MDTSDDSSSIRALDLLFARRQKAKRNPRYTVGTTVVSTQAQVKLGLYPLPLSVYLCTEWNGLKIEDATIYVGVTPQRLRDHSLSDVVNLGVSHARISADVAV